MILSDYFLSTPSVQWQLGKQLGVNHAVVRLPEDPDFDIANPAHIKAVADRFKEHGLHPLVVEPMPNYVHDHIKRGDAMRDECIEKVIKMIPSLAENGWETICTNFCAEVGWYRTSSTVVERGGALVTGFDLKDANIDPSLSISEETVWANLEYFLKAVVPVCEEHGIKIGLHPDDPPLKRLGNVSRVLISKANIQKAIDLVPSPNLGVTMCQANYFIMGEDLEKTIEEFADKIFFIHFRNTTGKPDHFRETFHDNGELPMAELIKIYVKNGVNVPIRVDHVPTMAGEVSSLPGYDSMGRLFAIGYLKGILEAVEGK